MQAAVWNKSFDMQVKECAMPDFKDNELLIKVEACGVCGTDIHMFEGQEGSSETKGGMVFGHELSGTVVSVGKDVLRFAVGDRVCVDPNIMCGNCYYCQNAVGHFCENLQSVGVTQNGGFAQYCAVPEMVVYKLPDNVTFEEGAMVEPVACCLHGIDMCNIRPGDDVVIIGAGMIGLIMLQLAKKLGACNIVVLEVLENRRQTATKLGATMTLDPTKDDVVAELKKKNIRAKAIIECAGKKVTAALATQLAQKKSTVMLFGLTNPDDTIEIKPFELFKKEYEIKASFINPYTQQRALNIISSKEIDVKIMVSGSLPLESLPSLLADKEKLAQGKWLVLPQKV